jgi:hypothetical protein
MAALTLLTSDTFQYFGSVFSTQWGIFENGIPVVAADTVASIEYRQEWAVADFPVEGGGFESYDKVYIPFDVRFRFAAGGSESNRTALLASIAAIAGNLVLYDASSPEATYLNCNVKHYDYRRTSINGVGLIIVDVWLTEVRIVGSTTSDTIAPSGVAIGATAAPGGAAPISGGSIQPIIPPSSLNFITAIPGS